MQVLFGYSDTFLQSVRLLENIEKHLAKDLKYPFFGVLARIELVGHFESIEKLRAAVKIGDYLRIEGLRIKLVCGIIHGARNELARHGIRVALYRIAIIVKRFVLFFLAFEHDLFLIEFERLIL